jgi:hypothetical protein
MRRSVGIITRSFSASVASRPNRASGAVPPPVAGTNGLSPPPRRHRAAFRQGWHVASRLDALLEAGRIDREAERLRSSGATGRS